MARDSSGNYSLPPSNPVFPGTVIESDWANDTMSDIALALTQSIAYNGETTPIANLPMGGFHHTNVSDPTSRNQYATLGMVQDGRQSRVNITSGVDNLIGTLVGGATGYAAGSIISFFAPATNTGPMTLNYNGIGARSVVAATGLPLAAGDIQAGAFLLAIYDGVQFKLLSQVASTTPSEALTANTTGQERPPGGVYPALTIASGTTVNVQAGTAWIVPAGGGSATEVTWATQTINLQYLLTSFSTTIAIDDTGTITQFAGRALGASLRNFAVIGVVTHPNGAATTVVTRPYIFADDGYRGTDVSSVLANSIISGALITPNSVAVMQLDISAGSIFMPGGSANSIDSPNLYPVFQQSNVPFRTLAGQNNISGGVISTAPVTSYDPNGAGAVVVIPNNADVVIHRLYYLYGSFIWVYGQRIFSSVENALSMIEWDRTQYRPSQYLQDAVLVAEIAARKDTTSLALIAQAAIVAPGGINFSIGSPGGIAEAPIDGTPYGRQDAAWVQVLRSISPQVSTSMTITGPTPAITEVMNPVGPGSAGLGIYSGVNAWFGLQVTNPDDKAYFRSYNPANGALRSSTIYDLATGGWNFPQNITFGGVGARILGDFSSVAVSDRVLFQTSLLNGQTRVGAIPNGTGNVSVFSTYSSPDPNNSSAFEIGINGGVGYAGINSNKTGTGAILPINFTFDGVEAMHIDTAGRVGIKTAPYPWLPAIPVLEIGPGSGLPNGGTSLHSGQATTVMTSNAYYDGAWKAKSANHAQQITMTNGGLHFNNAPSVAANAPVTFTERFRIDNIGRIGMGAVPSPWDIPAVDIGTAGILGNGATYITDNLYFGSGQWRLKTANPGSSYQQINGTHAFLTAPTGAANSSAVLANRLQISAAGNVNIDVLTEFGRLSVRQQSTTNPVAWFGNTTAGDSAIPTLQLVKQDINSTTAQKFIEFYMGGGGAQSGQINANGAGLAAFGAFSDRRLKENITTLPCQLANILALRPVEFDYIDGSGHQISFVAQDHQLVYSDTVCEDTKTGMLILTGWSKTEARLVSAIQGQQKIINKLEERLAALEAKCAGL